MSTETDQQRPPLRRNEQAPEEVQDEPKGPPAPAAGAEANDELRCTLCGLKACWTS